MSSLEDLCPERDLQQLRDALQACARSEKHLRRASSDTERRGLAMHYIGCLLRVVQVTAGSDVLKLAYGDDLPPDAGREDQILQLASRVRVAGRLFDDIADPDAPTSLRSLVAELRAIGNGGDPQLVAKLPAGKGTKRQEYRKSEYKFKALAWEQVLLRLGDSEKEARETVEAIFALGRLKDWRKELEDRFGSQLIRSLLEHARMGVLSEVADVHDRANALRRIELDKEAAYLKLKGAVT